MPYSSGDRPDPDQLRALLELASGEPELVVVDARALRLVMGPLGQLLILRPLRESRAVARQYDPDDDGYAWDSDDLC